MQKKICLFFDYDENSINETETRNIEVICTITVNNTPTKLKCTITGSDDNSIESMSIIYDDLGEWIRGILRRRRLYY